MFSPENVGGKLLSGGLMTSIEIGIVGKKITATYVGQAKFSRLTSIDSVRDASIAADIFSRT